jgi:hypothetical protein
MTELRGRQTWPEYKRMFAGEVAPGGVRADELIFWENKLIELDGERLLDVAWWFDTRAAPFILESLFLMRSPKCCYRTVHQDDGTDLEVSFALSNESRERPRPPPPHTHPTLPPRSWVATGGGR